MPLFCAIYITIQQKLSKHMQSDGIDRADASVRIDSTEIAIVLMFVKFGTATVSMET